MLDLDENQDLSGDELNKGYIGIPANGNKEKRGNSPFLSPAQPEHRGNINAYMHEIESGGASPDRNGSLQRQRSPSTDEK